MLSGIELIPTLSEKKNIITKLVNGFWASRTQPIFTCSKSTIETLGKGVKYIQSQHWIHQSSMTTFWCFYCWLWIYFTSFPSVSIVDFEQVHVGRWVGSNMLVFGFSENFGKVPGIEQASSEPRQTSKIESFNYFRKMLHLRCWQCFGKRFRRPKVGFFFRKISW